VNVSREFVLSGLASTLPPSVVGLEILEDELLDERFVHALIELKRRDYRLALDDFQYTVLEHLEVLRDGRAADRNLPRELAHRQWAVDEPLEGVNPRDRRAVRLLTASPAAMQKPSARRVVARLGRYLPEDVKCGA
jgi:hypothetical protein